MCLRYFLIRIGFRFHFNSLFHETVSKLNQVFIPCAEKVPLFPADGLLLSRLRLSFFSRPEMKRRLL